MLPPPRTRIVPSLLDALAVLFPVECAGCGRPDRSLCDACRAALRPRLLRNDLADGTVVVSALPYENVSRAVILAYKEEGRTGLARALAPALAAAIAAAASLHPSATLEVVCPPPARASYRKRGYDPVALLLRRARIRPTDRVLVGVRATSRQKRLDRDTRQRNRLGTLRAGSPLHGRTFLLVDDVLTTGATLTECARAIRAAGGTVAAAATVAYTEKRLPTA